MDVSELKFKTAANKKGIIALWDFGGQEEYYMTHSIFLFKSQPSACGG